MGDSYYGLEARLFEQLLTQWSDKSGFYLGRQANFASYFS